MRAEPEGASEAPGQVEVLSETGGSLGRVSVKISQAPSRVALAVMAHGAGGNMDHRILRDLAHGLSHRGITTVRFNFLYAEARRRRPDRTESLEACWRSVADWAREHLGSPPFPLFLGGKSMGGRIASHLAASGYPCSGLFFLGYPLHPPRRESRLRREHLPRIDAPLLFISGTRDALCRVDLLRQALAPLGDRARVHLIEGADHSFRIPRTFPRTDAELNREILDTLAGWISETGRASRD